MGGASSVISRLQRLWRAGSEEPPDGAVHVSMNDYWVYRLRDIPRVARWGMRFRSRWPATPGALGLWVAAFRGGRRQVSVSIWRSPDDLRRFVRSPDHLRVMREFRPAGLLYTNAWIAERFDPELIWQQAKARLAGDVEGVRHH